MASEIKPISGVDDRVKLSEAVPLDVPFTMNIFPTNACNFRCNYCAQSLGAECLKTKYNFSYETMPIELFHRAVEQMREFSRSFKLLSFMGHGEPLLHKKLPEMIHMVNDAGIAERIEIITNGSLLTHNLSEQLVEAGVDNVRVSLQGLSAEKYKSISGVDIDFAKFLDELAYFHSLPGKAKLFVKIVDAALEDGEAEYFYKMFAEISDRMYIERIKPVYDGVKYSEDVQNVLMDRYGVRHEKRLVCPMPFFTLSMWPNGDIVPCDAIYKPIVLGNVKEQSVYDMWHNKVLVNFQKMQLKKNRLDNTYCRHCCAPDDVSHPLDVLDDAAEVLLRNKF